MKIDALRIMAISKERGWKTAEEVRLIKEYRSRPAPAEDVAPWLHFLLEPDAIADCRRFYQDIYQLGLSIRDPEDFIERQFVVRMAERWPAIAAANIVFGGKIAAVLRLAARKRGQVPGWYGFAHGLSIGHPQDVESECDRVLRVHGASTMTYAEEAPDPYLMAASAAAWAKDVTDEGDKEECSF